MTSCKLVKEVEQMYMKSDLPEIKIGDTVRMHLRIIEGKKERMQIFTGTVIAKKGTGVSSSITVYRNAYGCSMERVFALHAPSVGKVEIVRSGKVRRAKLYYLRGESGKKARLQEKILKKLDVSSTSGKPLEVIDEVSTENSEESNS